MSRSPAFIYFVRSAEGADYSIGLWVDGEWVPGSHTDAIREYGLLDEPGSYVWGKSQAEAPPSHTSNLSKERSREDGADSQPTGQGGAS